jgi:hypothetical protein
MAGIGNLLKTKAVGWIAPVGTAFPTMALPAGAAWGGAWATMGLTKEPLKFKYEQEKFEFMVEEFRSAVKSCVVSRTVTLETVLAEYTAGHMALATNTALSTVQSFPATATTPEYFELSVGDGVGDACGCDPEYAVGFEGIYCDEAENQLPVRLFFSRMTMVMNGEQTYSQRDDDYTGVPLMMTALPDTTGKLFILQRATAPDTTP